MPYLVLEYATLDDARAGRTRNVMGKAGIADTAAEVAQWAVSLMTGRELSDLESLIRARRVAPPATRGPYGGILAKEVP